MLTGRSQATSTSLWANGSSSREATPSHRSVKSYNKIASPRKAECAWDLDHPACAATRGGADRVLEAFACGELKEFVKWALEGLEMRQEKAMEERTERLLAAIDRIHTPSCSPPMVEHLSPISPSMRPRPDLAGGMDDAVMYASAPSPVEDHDDRGSVELVASTDTAKWDRSGDTKDSEPALVGRFMWQWQSSAGPWKPYESAANLRLEKAYRRGESRTRLKSGTDGKVPMEIFFADMVQRDPDSKKVRSIRREGAPLTCWEWAKRHLQVIHRYLSAGQVPYESLQTYLDRQARLISMHHLDEGEGEVSVAIGEFSRTAQAYSKDLARSSWRVSASSRHLYDLHRFCRGLVKSLTFTLMSALVILLQIWWIWHSTDMNYQVNLYDQGVASVIIEHAICFYFLVEFAVNILALKFPRLWYYDTWLRLDCLCNISSIADILVFPPIYVAVGYDVTTRVSGGTALRVLRLVKLFRIGRLFGSVHEFNTVIKGTLRGMRAAGFILVLLAIALFVFGALMRTNSEHPILRAHFGSLGDSMVTLLTKGLFLDGVDDLFNDMIDAALFLPIFLFAVFMYISLFGLMSMLVGAFCSVADDVHQEEQEAKKLRELRSSLEEVAECYMADGRSVLNQKQFKLLMQNPDVHALLERSKIDVNGLLSFTTAWFRTSGKELPFIDLLELIVHLREGKAAVVSDVAGLQGYVLKRFDMLEELLQSAGIIGIQRERSMTSNAQ